jgi:hypothetical protein
MRKSKYPTCLASLKRELEHRGQKWPEQAFAAPKAPAYKASIATALLKSVI